MKTIILVLTLIMSSQVFSMEDLGIAEEALKKAHDAFLNKKYGKVSRQLKKVFKFSGGNQVIEENALGLLDAAYKERDGKRMPADWELPEGISFMKVGFRKQFNKMAAFTGYKIDMGLDIDDPSLLEQLKLVKFPNTIILDKERGIGNYAHSMSSNGKHYLYFGRRFEKMNFDGLYTVKIKLKDSEEVKGWFIASSSNVSATPVVNNPVDGSVYETGNPVFNWDSFFSPEYQGFERRRLSLKVTNFDLSRETTWSLHGIDPNRENVELGKEGDGVRELIPGDYLLHINYGERRKFGPVRVSRDSRTVVGFSVK